MSFFLSCFGFGNAQVSAIVADFKTRLPIAGATVGLSKENDTAVLAKITSSNIGYFNFGKLNIGSYILTVSHVNFSFYSALIKITNNNIGIPLDTILLKSDDNFLKDVKVTNKKPPLEFNGNKIILNVSESPSLSSGSAYDAVVKVPGMIELSNNFQFKGKSVLVLIDNKQTYLTGEDLKDLLSNMPAISVDKIEILSVPPTHYDAAAQSVINIKTIKNKNYGLNGIANLSGGIGIKPRYGGGLSLNLRKKTFNLYGSYNYEHSNTFFDVTLQRNLNENQEINESGHEVRIRKNNVYKLGIDLNPTKSTTLSVSFNGFSNDRNRINTNNITNIHVLQPVDSMMNVNWTGNGKYLNRSFNVFFKKQIDSAGQSITLNLDNIHYHKSLFDNYSTEYTYPTGQQYLPIYNLRDSSITVSNVYSVSVDYTKPIKNGHFDAGAKGSFTKNENNILWQSEIAQKWIQDSLLTQHNKYNENIIAAYISAVRSIGHYEISVGIRFEQTNLKLAAIDGSANIERNFGGIFPNLSIEYKKNESNVINFSYRRSIERPTFRDLSPYINYYSSYSYYTGNPNILPQYNNDYNLTYTYKSLVTFGVEYTRSFDLILPAVERSTGNLLYYGMANIDHSNLCSATINVSKQVNKIWWFNFSNSLQYLDFSDAAKIGIGNSGFSYVGDLKNTFTFKEGWTAELSGNYNSSAPFGIYRLNNGFLSGAGASVQKSLFKGAGKIGFTVSDIFNTSTQKYSTGFNGIYFKKDDKVESRFFRLNFTYKFGNKSIKPKQERKNNIEDLKNRING